MVPLPTYPTTPLYIYIFFQVFSFSFFFLSFTTKASLGYIIPTGLGVLVPSRSDGAQCRNQRREPSRLFLLLSDSADLRYLRMQSAGVQPPAPPPPRRRHRSVYFSHFLLLIPPFLSLLFPTCLERTSLHQRWTFLSIVGRSHIADIMFFVMEFKSCGQLISF